MALGKNRKDSLDYVWDRSLLEDGSEKNRKDFVDYVWDGSLLKDGSGKEENGVCDICLWDRPS